MVEEQGTQRLVGSKVGVWECGLRLETDAGLVLFTSQVCPIRGYGKRVDHMSVVLI